MALFAIKAEVSILAAGAGICWFYYLTSRQGMKYAMRKQGFWQNVYKYVENMFEWLFPILFHCFKICLHRYHKNACAYLEYLILIFCTKTCRSCRGLTLASNQRDRSLKWINTSLTQNNLISVDHFPEACLGATVLQVDSCWPWV